MWADKLYKQHERSIKATRLQATPQHSAMQNYSVNNTTKASQVPSSSLVLAKRSSSTLKNSTILTSFMTSFPKFSTYIGLRYYYSDVNDFFVNLVQRTMQIREKNPAKYQDFFENLMNLKKSNEITNSELIAQTFIFLAAGNETSALTISYCLYELALNPDIQQELREEIKNALQQSEQEISYEIISKLSLLDRVFKGMPSFYIFYFQFSLQFMTICSVPRSSFKSSQTWENVSF